MKSQSSKIIGIISEKSGPLLPSSASTTPSDVKHRVPQIMMDTTSPIQSLRRVRSRLGTADGAGAVGIHDVLDIASSSLAEEIGIVGWWADGNGFRGSAKEVAEIVGLVFRIVLAD
jgi:hypothetical protein